MALSKPDHWNQHARQWSLIGPPLRPSAEDISLLEQALTAWSASNVIAAPHALLCGVTPEIACMRWPSGTRLTAVDRSQAMIAGVWLAGELRRVAAPGSLLAIRFFLRPDCNETVGQVIDDLQKGRIGNFHAFKWRLAMAMHGTIEEGVRLGDVWDVWHQAVPQPDALAAQLGWSPAVVNTIQNYRGVSTCYSFPTMDEARGLTGDFRIVAVQVPDYELGERCPTLVMQPT